MFMEKRKKERRKVSPVRKWIERLILLIAVCVFIYAGWNLYTIFKANDDEAKDTERLRDTAKIPTKEEDLDKFKVDFDALKKVNPDIVGWIVVLDTEISYPVVKGSDNEYYLNHLYDKTENYAGSIFMDYRNNEDLSDPNTFIYGHNVHHGTMFAELENYVKKDFFEKHPYVYYYTPDASYKLQVFSAYVDKGDSQSYNISFGDDASYQAYLDYVKGLSRHTNDVTVTAKEHIITLYTCSYEDGRNPGNTEAEYIDDRYFVHCKIVKALNGEMPYEKSN
ncbi:sortase B [Breznakia sp. PF5-3]|nr:sortase B [Breznakia sp. PM6-1]MDF9835412.1 sortase B [Breznakia sp. PF5-3]